MTLFSEKRRDAFFQEFPWLSKYISQKHRKYIQQILVSRVDKDLLGRIILEKYIDSGEGDGYYLFERIILLDKNGDIIKRELPLEEFSLWKPHTWRRHRSVEGRVDFSQTVAECIVSLGNESDKIAFIFSSFCNYLVIYKPPKRFNVQTLLKEVAEDKRRREEEEKRKEEEAFIAQRRSIREDWDSLNP
ncbi:MAG: hypothetical protein WC848_05405 [Parcubacteria group bacterium]|jgi:hypothetical protein